MSSQPGQVRKKTVYHLGTPFTTTSWPEVNQEAHDAIIELLCAFLEPLGLYRQRYAEPSKGKVSRKRKRTAAKKAATRQFGDLKIDPITVSKPPPPVIADHVDIGLTTITRNLQFLSAPKRNLDFVSSFPGYSLVFIARSGQPSILHSHFPELVAAATHNGSSSPIRLVGISSNCADRLTKAVGLPRVSAVAIRTGAPNAKALLDYVEQNVPVIASPWIDSVTTEFKFVPLNIIGVPTKIGQRKQRKPLVVADKETVTSN